MYFVVVVVVFLMIGLSFVSRFERCESIQVSDWKQCLDFQKFMILSILFILVLVYTQFLFSVLVVTLSLFKAVVELV